jgi:hypothetical protein
MKPVLYAIGFGVLTFIVVGFVPPLLPGDTPKYIEHYLYARCLLGCAIGALAGGWIGWNRRNTS